jgi:two-component system invasion response regulator UvrY
VQAAITVLIIDDQALVRECLKRILDDVLNVRVVAEAASHEEAIRAVKEFKPNTVILSIKIPGTESLKVMQAMLNFNPDLKILMLSGTEDDALATRSLQAGAMGYLTKKASSSEFIQAIKAITVNQRYISPKIASQMALRNISHEHLSPFDTLSGRELQVTLMQIDSLSIEEMAQKLGVSPKTINSYRYRIFEKLSVKSDIELVLLAVKYGLKDIYAEEY